MHHLYGLPNCDSVRRARRWLDEHGIGYHFHDLRQEGVDEAQLRAWSAELGWERLLNRRGTTWRRLPAEARDPLDETGALRLMRAHPALIRRPLLDLGTQRHLGFDEVEYAALFNP